MKNNSPMKKHPLAWPTIKLIHTNHWKYSLNHKSHHNHVDLIETSRFKNKTSTVVYCLSEVISGRSPAVKLLLAKDTNCPIRQLFSAAVKAKRTADCAQWFPYVLFIRRYQEIHWRRSMQTRTHVQSHGLSIVTSNIRMLFRIHIVDR